MVANNLKRRHPVWQRMRPLPKTGPTDGAGPNAPSSGIAIRTIPEMGIGFRWTIQATSDANRKQIYHRRHRLLHKMGGSKSTTRQYGGIKNKFFILVHMVPVWLSDSTDK